MSSIWYIFQYKSTNSNNNREYDDRSRNDSDTALSEIRESLWKTGDRKASAEGVGKSFQYPGSTHGSDHRGNVDLDDKDCIDDTDHCTDCKSYKNSRAGSPAMFCHKVCHDDSKQGYLSTNGKVNTPCKHNEHGADCHDALWSDLFQNGQDIVDREECRAHYREDDHQNEQCKINTDYRILK